MSAMSSQPLVHAAEQITGRWGWLLAFGVVQMLVGCLAIGAPLAASIASAVFFGWLLLLSGAVQAVHAFQVRRWKGFVLHLLGALLYVGAGVVLVVSPLSGALTLTLLLAVFLVVEGVSRCTLALRIRPAEGWLWFLLGGIAGVVVGAMLWIEWPGSGLWAVGLLLGINLLFSGLCLTSLALTVRRSASGAT